MNAFKCSTQQEHTVSGRYVSPDHLFYATFMFEKTWNWSKNILSVTNSSLILSTDFKYYCNFLFVFCTTFVLKAFN